jgi:hypothetical protein
MNNNIRSWMTALASILAVTGQASEDIKGFAPVSVSSANYRTTERAELVRKVSEKNQVNPVLAKSVPRSTPAHYIFMPGEIYESDLTYEQLCKLLTPALASKGFINGSDDLGIIREPDRVELILKVNYGTRPWRRPVVRTEQLTWRDGLEARPTGRGLQNLGGDRLWDSRAGGNDDALTAARENQSSGSAWSKGGGKAGAGAGPDSGGAPSAGVPVVNTGALGLASLTGYEVTRDFHLIAIDAFDYAEVKKDGKTAKRIWTTFVAAPKDPKQPFSEMVSALIRNATPFFGETSSGLQVYTDARAEVKIGESVVVPE